MRKFIICLLLLNLVSACQSAREGFSLKKKDNSDEFLVKKKSPLVMPPNYYDLPEPKNLQINTKDKKEDEFEKIISNSKNFQNTNDKKKTNIEKSVFEKIK